MRVACNGDESPVLRLSWVAQLMYRDGIEVKNSWIYTSAFPYVSMTWRLVTHRATLPFTVIRRISEVALDFG